jgi:hypothetical protein
VPAGHESVEKNNQLCFPSLPHSQISVVTSASEADNARSNFPRNASDIPVTISPEQNSPAHAGATIRLPSPVFIFLRGVTETDVPEGRAVWADDRQELDGDLSSKDRNIECGNFSLRP